MKKVWNLITAICMTGLLVSCTTMPLKAKQSSVERKQEIVQQIIEHGQLIDLFKRAEEIYENNPKPGDALYISHAVKLYIENRTRNPDEIYRLIKNNNFETYYRRTFDEIPDGVMCKILRRCDQAISGSMHAGSYHLVIQKFYRVSVEIADGRIIELSASVRAD